MTTPAGVPNLPAGALTVSTLGKKLQDQTVSATRGRAGERVPTIFNASTGGNITADLTPFGIITRIWAQVNSLIAQADPADINGPEDIPALLIDFIEGLPVVGQFVQLLEAFTGGYTGDDPVLLTIQELFGPIVELVQNVVEILTGAPGALDDLKQWATSLPLIGPIVATLTGDPDAADFGALGSWARSLLTGTSKIPADNLFGTISSALLGIIPVSHIGPSNPNLLVQSAFEDATTVDATDGWTWDGAENRPGSTPGSAKLDVAGTSGTRQLVANQDIAVLPGDRLAVSAWVKTSATYNGDSTSLVLSLVPFIGTVEQTPITLVTRATSTSWVQMTGNYTVPQVTGSQVTSMRVRMAVTSSATAGSVWWDDISLSKTGNLGQNLVENLIDAWNLIWKGAFGVTTSVVGKVFSDLEAALGYVLTRGNLGVTRAGTANDNIGLMSTGIFNGWFGSGGTGDVAQVQTTVAAIKTAVAGGWTLETLTTGTSWSCPWPSTMDAPKEFWAICIGGGGGGGKGPSFSSGALGGSGGTGGGYVAQQIDPAAVSGTTVSYTIGVGGTGKTSGTTDEAPGTATNFGTFATSSATVGSIGNLFGYQDATSSKPGDGGAGGRAYNTGTTTAGTAGASGGSTPLASGGTGGAYSSNNNGGAGGTGATASLTGQTRAGGGGGGGGGGARTGAGGLGGNGGFPGSGAGGGGAASNNNGGNGGNGGYGVIVLLYK